MSGSRSRSDRRRRPIRHSPWRQWRRSTARPALESAGVEVRWADETEIPGQRRFFVSDPWGNRLELRSPQPIRSASSTMIPSGPRT